MIRSIVAFAIALPLFGGVRDISCDQIAAARYRLQFTLEPGTKVVQIFASTQPDKMEGAREVARATSSPIEVSAGEPGQRIYFHLKPDHGPVRVVSIRRLPLEGTPNFRDLGGYPAAGGRNVRWGTLYRSGVLAGLTDSDYQYLGQLGIHVVCDFRTDAEQTAAATKWRGGSTPEFVHLPIGTSGSGPGSQVANFANPEATPAELKARIVDAYQNFAGRAEESYRGSFAELMQGKLPMLVHCSAGKDRTGVFSAVLLTALGVPRDIVLQDYELTNRALRDNQENQKRLTRATGNTSGLAGLSAEQIRPLMAADPAYLEVTFRAIDEKYGSFDNYRRNALGVSDEALRQLRDRLLE